jgi:hypothetical protein
MAVELRVANKYRLGRKIGSGSFGDIYLGAFSLRLPAPGGSAPLTIARARTGSLERQRSLFSGLVVNCIIHGAIRRRLQQRVALAGFPFEPGGVFDGLSA